MVELWGPEKIVGVGRELTKAHEELVVQPIHELIEKFKDPRGEFTVLVPPQAVDATSAQPPDAATVACELGELTNRGELKRREALRILAERYGVRVNSLYKLLE